MFCTNCGAEQPEAARFCFSCGTALDAGASPEPDETSEISDQTRKRAMLIGLALAPIIFGALFFVSRPAPRPAEEKTCGDWAAAMIYSESHVRAQLRSPSTAKFPGGPWREGVRIGELEKCTWLVKSWVDSQNGFGATIRTDYAAVMEYLPESKEWKVSSLEFFNN